MAHLQTIFDHAVQDERLVAIGLCSVDGQLLRSTDDYPDKLTCANALATAARADHLLRIAVARCTWRLPGERRIRPRGRPRVAA